MRSRYHLFRRPVSGGGAKDASLWYYWFLGADGARVRRATGCARKGDAEDFIARLELADAKATEAAASGRPARAKLRQIADPLFLPGSSHLQRLEGHGRGMKASTSAQHRRWIDLYLLPDWGEKWVDEIRGPDIEDWLQDLTSRDPRDKSHAVLSSASRNNLARTFLAILSEARRAGLIDQVPVIELFRRHAQPKDILTDDELGVLFPPGAEELARIWGRPASRGRDAEPLDVGVMFGALFCLCVSAGLRPGEGRAVHVDQLYPEVGGMVIDRAYDVAMTLGAPKSSRDDAPRYRVVYLPEKTWSLLSLHQAMRRESKDHPGLLFAFRDHPIRTSFLRDRFIVGLDNAMLDRTLRNLTPHSLRYTYDTKMRRVLDANVLREFLGHRSEQMSGHYDRAVLRPALETRLLQLSDQKGAVNLFWRNERAERSRREDPGAGSVDLGPGHA